MKLYAIAAASVLVLAAGSAAASTVVVAGTSDPFLAGSSGGDSITFDTGDVDTAAAESPVAVSVTAGETLSITAVNDPTLGSVGNCPGCQSGSPAGGGDISVQPFTTSGYTALATSYTPGSLPINSLVGLFNDSSPTVFEIGNGGIFTVPTGATTLYLGTVDGYQWNNNVGAFDVTLAAVPEPAAWALMLVGFGAMGAALRSRRRLAAA